MNRNPICKYLLRDGIMLRRILPVVRRKVRATLAMQYCFCNVGIINCRVWRINIPSFLMKTGNLEMMASSASSDTLRSFLCLLDGFYEERGQLVALEVKQKHMRSIIVLTSSRSVGVTMQASGTSSTVPAMLLVGREMSPSMLVLWAKSTTLAHISSEGVAAPKSFNRIDSPSKFIVIKDKGSRVSVSASTIFLLIVCGFGDSRFYLLRQRFYLL